MLNGWFQGMGFPPCARLLTHWFAPKEFATKMSIWNISHSLGAGLILVLCGFVLVPISWRLCFLVPAAIALVCCALSVVRAARHASLGRVARGGRHSNRAAGAGNRAPNSGPS